MNKVAFETTILSLERFRSNYRRVLVASVGSEFENLIRPEGEDEIPIDWKYLLFAGSVLGLSDLEESQEAALRIAHGCLARSSASDIERAAAATILSQLSNDPSISL